MTDRFVVLGVAPVRREWFRRVGRWSNEALVPVEFVKCISIGEVHSRLRSGRALSALLVDASTPGLDRDVLDAAASVGCSPIVIDHGLVNRDWNEVGAHAVLPERFEPNDLLAVLDAHAQPIHEATGARAVGDTGAPALSDDAAVVTVTGAGGLGTSTIAMALAQGLTHHSDRRPVLLADMALGASQAMMHDARDVVPGLLELIDSHRLGIPNSTEALRAIHQIPERNYDLVLGLRHERDWVSIGSRALSATWSTLLGHYGTIVCDVTGDFDGADQTGSNDIEDRNRLARMAALQADVVAVVGVPGAWGIHHLVRTILSLHEIGVSCDRMQPVINHGPRQPKARAGIASAIADLVRSRVPDAEVLASPIFTGTRRNLDAILRDGHPLPKAMTAPIASSIAALVSSKVSHRESGVVDPSAEPVAVVPGSLGTWSDADD